MYEHIEELLHQETLATLRIWFDADNDFCGNIEIANAQFIYVDNASSIEDILVDLDRQIENITV